MITRHAAASQASGTYTDMLACTRTAQQCRVCVSLDLLINPYPVMFTLYRGTKYMLSEKRDAWIVDYANDIWVPGRGPG